MKQQRVLLQGGRIIDMARRIDRIADVLVVDGGVVAMGTEARTAEHDAVHDVTGCVVLPAFIDLCASLREGEKQHGTIASETHAAAKAGFAHVVLPPNAKLVIDNPAMVAQIKEKAQTADFVTVYPLGALTKGLEGQQPANMHALTKAGCLAVTNVRHGMANDETLLRCLEYAASLNLSL